MTTRRERLEAKIEKREQWAESRKADSDRRFNAARTIADGIPMGQPILVGHHSEAHHRRDIARIDGNMRKACESADMAAHHESKAAGLANQLDRSIFSDDHDAIAQLESRIAEREADCARMTALNKLVRKEFKAGLPEGWLARVGATEAEAKAMLDNMRFCWTKAPMFAPYHMANLRGRIRADRERLKAVQARQARTALADEAGGVAVEVIGDYARVTFSDKPARAVINALKAAGYWWKGGSWAGRHDALPACVRELVEGEQA